MNKNYIKNNSCTYSRGVQENPKVIYSTFLSERLLYITCSAKTGGDVIETRVSFSQ